MSLDGNSELVDAEFDAAPSDPLELYARWLAAAVEVGVSEPNGLVLATSDTRGRSSTRVVLLKGVENGGFVFATSSASPKGRDLQANDWASGTLWWRETIQQINIGGHVHALSPDESDAMFHERTPEARAVATASAQSAPLADEDELARKVNALVEAGADQPRPDHWQGYRLVPEWVEFWHGRRNRLHRRLRYTRSDAGWTSARLQP